MKEPFVQHGVERLFQYFTAGQVTLRRRDAVEVGGITLKQHVFGTPHLSLATDPLQFSASR